MQQQSTLYAESQDLQATLKPLLESQINNPTGFNAQELADLNANNVNTTGAQYANVQKQLDLANSSNNMKGLTSGVAAGERASLQNMAAGTVASNATNVELANAELAQQNKNTAQSELLGLESGTAGNAISQGQVENTSESNAFNQANTEQQQSSQLMNTIVGGVIGAGSAFATGGASMIGCWIAAEVYGDWSDPRVLRAREVIFGTQSWGWRIVARLYLTHGERVARMVARSRTLKAIFKFAFDRIQ
jgi:hypothetical protein